MSIKNINDSFIINEFQKENINLTNITSSFENTKAALHKRFNNLSDEECDSIVDIMKNISSQNETENSYLTVTAPNSFKLKNQTTYAQIENLIDSAKKQIIKM